MALLKAELAHGQMVKLLKKVEIQPGSFEIMFSFDENRERKD